MPTFCKSFCACIPQRWVVVIMGFSALINVYAMRICLSIVITEMVIPLNHTKVLLADDTCPTYVNDTFTNITNSHKGTFHWSERTQGKIFSSFYWGYIFTNVVGGMTVHKLGGKHSLGISILSTSVLTLLTPASVYWADSTGLIILRVLMGFGEGTTYPAVNELLARWIPVEERSKAGAFIHSGAPIGMVFALTASGAILRYSKTGWPMVFYFFGTVGMISFLLNCGFCYSRPSDHPFISKGETEYLKEKLKNVHKNLPPTPWSRILRSVPVWALIIQTFGFFYGFVIIISDMPKYLSSVMHVSVQKNGFLSSLMHLSKWLGSCVFSCIADWVIASKILSIGKVRKIGSTVAGIGCGAFLMLASYAGCDLQLFTILLVIGLTCLGCVTFSVLVNGLDLSPNYAGALIGLSNGVGTLGGIIAPYVAGVLTPNQSISEWRLTFWTVFACYTIGSLVFVFFGSGELQEWNDPSFLEKDIQVEKSEEKEGIELLQIKKNGKV